MRVAFAILNGRIAPLFDTARALLMVDFDSGPIKREQVAISDELPVRKVIRLADIRADALVCGAISAHLRGIISAYGIDLVAFISGDIDDVIAAFAAGELDKSCFAMPGCRRRCRRRGAGRGEGFAPTQ